MQCFAKIMQRAPFTPFPGTKEHVIQKVMESLKKNQNSVQTTTTFSMVHDSVSSRHTMPLGLSLSLNENSNTYPEKHPERSLIAQISMKTKLQEPTEREEV